MRASVVDAPHLEQGGRKICTWLIRLGSDRGIAQPAQCAGAAPIFRSLAARSPSATVNTFFFGRGCRVKTLYENGRSGKTFARGPVIPAGIRPEFTPRLMDQAVMSALPTPEACVQTQARLDQR